ncbi:hypothetical protein HPB50_000990 [Hyalomma asiaticum]|uniref:Uncharacterized protein n=1 Tax=Hyalomma asiaticum TaxID=266040 RepID=A0ACB7SS51_HYAAI|nr:hypothetical protein HPB50_000990 [Hyalomma asiaticum]
MSELPQGSSVPTLSNVISSAKSKSAFTEIQREPTDDIVGSTESSDCGSDSAESPCSPHSLKTTDVPIASPPASVPEHGNAIVTFREDSGDVTVASVEHEVKDKQQDDEEASLEDSLCCAEEGMLASGSTAPWPTKQLGLDARGRTYWPGRCPRGSVSLPQSNCPYGEPSWWYIERLSPLPQASIVPDFSCLYLYGRTSRGALSPTGNGAKASTACLAAFVFAIVMLCLWMFQVVGEYRVPESAVYPAPMESFADKVKGAGGTYAGEALPHPDGERRAGHTIQRTPPHYDGEGTTEGGDWREKATGKTTVRIIPQQEGSGRRAPRSAVDQFSTVPKDKD